MVLPLGEGAVELGDVAEERRFGQELADEDMHRLGDAFEREHLRDEQVHDIGLDALGRIAAVRASGGESAHGFRRDSAGSA